MDDQSPIVKHRLSGEALSSPYHTVSLLLFLLNLNSYYLTNKELLNTDRKIRHDLRRKHRLTAKKAKRAVDPIFPYQEFNGSSIRTDNPILWYSRTSIGMQFHI